MTTRRNILHLSAGLTLILFRLINGCDYLIARHLIKQQLNQEDYSIVLEHYRLILIGCWIMLRVNSDFIHFSGH